MTNEAGKGTVLWDLDARGVATVTLNRPQVNNAYNGDMIAGLHEAMDMLGAKAGLRMVVIRGNGRHFQAGADLEWIAGVGRAGPEENERASRATAEAVRRLDTLPVPTVALVHGGCFGGGTGIVAACDIVVAADSCSLRHHRGALGIDGGHYPAAALPGDGSAQCAPLRPVVRAFRCAGGAANRLRA